MSAALGTYMLGEVPPPLVYTFLDSGGAAVDLSDGYTARFNYGEHDGAASSAAAAVTDGAAGQVTYTWTGAEFTTAGQYTAEFWVGNGTTRLASVPITWNVQVPTGPVPAI